MERVNPDVEGAASRSAEEAQQRSAWACVRAIEWSESDGCIGHPAPSEQHAILASGVAIQPAQTEAGPAAKPSTSTRRMAEKRLLTSTSIRMRERRGTVNGRRTTASDRVGPRLFASLLLAGAVRATVLSTRPARFGHPPLERFTRTKHAHSGIAC